jgi:hypothetical protein
MNKKRSPEWYATMLDMVHWSASHKIPHAKAAQLWVDVASCETVEEAKTIIEKEKKLWHNLWISNGSP